MVREKLVLHESKALPFEGDYTESDPGIAGKWGHFLKISADIIKI
jgi:hypothetical protein